MQTLRFSRLVMMVLAVIGLAAGAGAQSRPPIGNLKVVVVPARATYALDGAALYGLSVLAVAPAADDPPQFTDWSTPVNLGSPVNSTYYEGCPTISKSGLSLFFRTNLPGGQGGADIWVTQRDSLDEPWDAPVNLGEKVNSSYNETCTGLSPDEHWMVFVSDRPGGCGLQDLWITHRQNRRDDFGWESPTNLGCGINSASHDNAPRYFDDPATGETLLYFAGGRPGGPGSGDIWVTPALDGTKDTFGPPSLVAEFSIAGYNDSHPLMRKDGLEFIFVSNRPGGLGSTDLWSSTRASMEDPWPDPVNLTSVNSAPTDFRPTLSFDGRMLIFASDRPGGLGGGDLYVSTRTKLPASR